MDVKIVRSTTGSKTCDWCRRLAGTYDYADVRKTGHDVWKRHAYCDCRIEYVSSSERYDVENYKKITKAENRERIAQRKAVQAADDRSPEKIAARKALAGVGEEERPRKHFLRDNPETKVDWQAVNSLAYHKKFASITDNETLNENLYKAAKEILNHRDGFLQEDMYLLEKESGKVVYKHTSSTDDQGVVYTKKMRSLVKNNPGKYVTIHNHPQCRPPSLADIDSQKRNVYDAGVVVTHDGRVFVYRVRDDYINIRASYYELMIANYKKAGYNETEAQIRTLEDLSNDFGFEFMEVIRDE